MPYYSMTKALKDDIWSVLPLLPMGICKTVATRMKARRLQFGWSRETLASRSGVNIYRLKRFELSGQITLEALVKVGVVLGTVGDFEALFAVRPEAPNSMADLEKLNPPPRKRGRTLP
jgi:transcriptional regulator with XRE-family HTH domain